MATISQTEEYNDVRFDPIAGRRAAVSNSDAKGTRSDNSC